MTERGIVVSLFDYSGVMVKPWLDADYECWIVDIQHPPGITLDGSLYRVRADLSQPWIPPLELSRVAFVSAFPPCDHLAVSGARWFQGKGLRALSESIAMFATAAEFCESTAAPYLIENPVSTISMHWRKPDYTFHPHEYAGFCLGDNYTKKTCLWVGNGFVMPPKHPGIYEPDDRIHKCPPGPDRKNIRSQTPAGFAKAVFLANTKQREAA